ncbi:hypothetical protein KSF_084310 [Reticulibacter mediterranei]|uniref:N-acetyltransferase domain-containing protein n=1 Tax=Reticulibacter mediterranei TaxID=2778369 RepID=A0A8J3ITN7_9CHLR|nr:GNAT family N-acetyltransferase [Reticulibacter mediterranei]GHO98383.1 hypothetical protein KSF_084310 [Reticulibacter mediterranei]
MDTFVMTQTLALQLEQANADSIDSWFRGMLEQAGDYFGVNVYRVGQVRAFAARKMQEMGHFNQVIGLGPEQQHYLPEIVRFYAEQGITQYRIEINPFHVTSDFLAYLASLRCHHTGFQTYVFGPSTLDPLPLPPAISLQEVTSSENDLFADMHVQGFQEALIRAPLSTRQLYRESTKVLCGFPGWHLYLVNINGTPSGMGMLYIENGRALLAGGATLPQFRRRGSHRALLCHRIQAAAQAKCSIVVAQTNAGSESQRNMENLGMRTAYTAAIWKSS